LVVAEEREASRAEGSAEERGEEEERKRRSQEFDHGQEDCREKMGVGSWSNKEPKEK